MHDFAVLYSSVSGNTEKIASVIFNALPSDNSVLLNIKQEVDVPQADMYFIGFGVHNETCSMDVLNVLEQIGDKKVVFFATCGRVPNDETKKRLINSVNAWLEDDQFVGMYLCQGKLPDDLYAQYHEKCKSQIGKTSKAQDILIKLEELQKHPDRADYENAMGFVRQVVQNLHLF